MSYIEKVLLVFLCIIIINSVYQCNAYGQSAVEIDNYCHDVAEYYGIPYEILPAIIRVESDYLQSAVSHKDAYGLMQVRQPAYIDYSNRNPVSCKRWISNYSIVKSDWKANISVGAWYLVKICYEPRTNWKFAITAYNYGVNHTKKLEHYYNKVKKEMKWEIKI